jgi:large subunit ribosomal protein L18
VFRSNKALYVQVIDDVGGKTLIGLNEQRVETTVKNKIERAKEMGKQLAAKLKEKKVTQAVFDRGGFAYHGRVKAIAEGLREGGITL